MWLKTENQDCSCPSLVYNHGTDAPIESVFSQRMLRGREKTWIAREEAGVEQCTVTSSFSGTLQHKVKYNRWHWSFLHRYGWVWGVGFVVFVCLFSVWLLTASLICWVPFKWLGRHREKAARTDNTAEMFTWPEIRADFSILQTEELLGAAGP